MTFGIDHSQDKSNLHMEGRRMSITLIFTLSLSIKSYSVLASVRILMGRTDFRRRIVTTSHLLKGLTSADRA